MTVRLRPSVPSLSAAALLAVVLMPAVAEAAIAGTGYSANLSSNPSVRRQQLLCDPDDPYSGSTSTEYDPTVVFLAAVNPVTGYMITNDGKFDDVFVEVRDPNNEVNELIRLERLNFYREELGAKETGYVQVFFQTEGTSTTGGTGGPVPPTPQPGFFVEDTDGPEGAVTHSLEFQYFDTVPDDTDATYRNYADVGRANGGRGAMADILTRRDPDTGMITPIPFTGTPDQIDAIVTGDLIVPEPSSLALAGLGAVALLARRGKR